MSTLKVGLMTLTGIIAVVIMSFKVTSNQSGFGEYITYKAITEDASGILPKTSIRVAGIKAGRIEKIELKGNSALITFEVLKRVRIAEDSKLRVKAVGFFGDKYLEIFLGESAKTLKEGSVMVLEHGGGIENLLRDITEVVQDAKKIVKGVGDALIPENQESRLEIILNGAKHIIQDSKQIISTLRGTVTDNREKINSIVDNFEQFSYELAYQVDKANQDSSVNDIKKILSNVQSASESIKEVMNDLKAGRGTVGRLLREDKIIDEVEQTLSGVNKLVGRVNSLQTELNLYLGSDENSGSATDLSLRIVPAPERFYELGISTSEYGRVQEKETTTVTDGGTPVVVTKKEKEKGKYLFNAQIGRRFQNWVVRAGLIETTGGFGIDYVASRWNMKFTSEVFDYRENIGPNVRMGFETQVWNTVYGRVQFEDVFEETKSTTISAGFKFNDSDIKGIIGFFL